MENDNSAWYWWVGGIVVIIIVFFIGLWIGKGHGTMGTSTPMMEDASTTESMQGVTPLGNDSGVSMANTGSDVGTTATTPTAVTAPVSGTVAASQAPNTAGVINATFTCNLGKGIVTEFGSNFVDLVTSDHRVFQLPQVISADGARYSSPGEAFVFWNKGRGAFVTERGTVTFDNCQQL